MPGWAARMWPRQYAVGQTALPLLAGHRHYYCHWPSRLPTVGSLHAWLGALLPAAVVHRGAWLLPATDAELNVVLHMHVA